MTVLRYDAQALIESVRNQARLPDVDAPGSLDSDILRHLNEELVDKLLPAIIAAREEDNVYTERRTLTANVSRYQLNKRAAGPRVREIMYRNDGGAQRHLDKIDRRMRARYGNTATDQPRAFYLEWNNLVIVPPLGAASGVLDISYYFRPSTIVLIEETAIVTARDLAAGTVTCGGGVPTTFLTGLAYDIHGPDSGGQIRLFDKVATLAGNVLTFAAVDINGSVEGTYAPQVGDFVCLAGECAVPFVPYEFHSILAKMTALIFLRQQGDFEAVNSLKEELEAGLKLAIGVLKEDRVEDQAPVVVNQHSFLGRTPGRKISMRDDEF